MTSPAATGDAWCTYPGCTDPRVWHDHRADLEVLSRTFIDAPEGMPRARAARALDVAGNAVQAMKETARLRRPLAPTRKG